MGGVEEGDMLPIDRGPWLSRLRTYKVSKKFLLKSAELLHLRLRVTIGCRPEQVDMSWLRSQICTSVSISIMGQVVPQRFSTTMAHPLASLFDPV